MPRRIPPATLVACIVLAISATAVGVSAQSPSPGSSPARAPGSSTAASPAAPSPATSSHPADVLADGLLQAIDLPGLAPATDVTEGTDYDIDDAAFMANDGTRIVSRTWGVDSDVGPSIVFDFRIQFPTPEAAAAYLAAALPTLSEVTATGLAPLADVPSLGDQTYGFGLDTQGETGPVSVRTYLFRVGAVVAKVLAGGAAITGDQALTIAQAASARVTSAGAPPVGSPRPAPTPTPAPSASAAGPLPSGDLTALLLAHVPETIAPTCTPDEQRLWEGELVTLVCAPPDADVSVTYSGFDTLDHMGAAYQSSLDTLDLADPTDGCDLGTWSGSYQVEGEAVGQATCWSEPNGRAIMWSDDRLSMLSVAVSPSLDSSSLYQWWLGAGPIP